MFGSPSVEHSECLVKRKVENHDARYCKIALALLFAILDNGQMEKLKAYIKNSEVTRTQSEWAKDFGISRNYLSEILSGKQRPGWKTIQKIHRATGGTVSPDAWLTKGDAV